MTAATPRGEEFMVWIRNQYPVATPTEGHSELIDREKNRVAELVAEGTLIRLWRIAGRRENVGLFVAKTASELHQILESLPMYPHLKITVIPLAHHDSDPGHSETQ
jgi:muconolactone D-isomerase